MSSSAILDFVDSGKSLILAASSDASDTVRGLALEVGVELDDAGTALFDHFNYQTAAGADDASLVATGAVLQSSAVFGAESPSVRAMRSAPTPPAHPACSRAAAPAGDRLPAGASERQWLCPSPATTTRTNTHTHRDACAPVAPCLRALHSQAPVLFRGVAATVPSSSELVMVALSGEGTSYSTDASKALPDPPALPVGAGAALVSLVQVCASVVCGGCEGWLVCTRAHVIICRCAK